MKPFNLEAALRGEKVVTRDGREVTQLVKFDASRTNQRIVGVIEGWLSTWDDYGVWAIGHQNSRDLFMHEEPEEVWTPTMELRWAKKIHEESTKIRAQVGLEPTWVGGLQQKWISGSGTANEPFKVEWRDVPTVSGEK